jgi:uncharacterized membrane protein
MYDIEDFAIGAFLVLCVLALIGIGVVAIADGVSTAEGTVTEKYYDDPDWVCTKGCYRTSECWTLVIGEEPFWNEHTCVERGTYDDIDIGDYYRE